MPNRREHLSDQANTMGEQATTIEEVVRVMTRNYLSYAQKQTVEIIPKPGEPLDSTDSIRNGALDYLAPIIARHYKLPMNLARAASDLAFELSVAAGRCQRNHELPGHQMEDLALTIILGGINTLSNEILVHKKVLER